MPDEHDDAHEPSESLVNDWNIHNDHADDGEHDDDGEHEREEDNGFDEDTHRDIQADAADQWADSHPEPPVITGADEIEYAREDL